MGLYSALAPAVLQELELVKVAAPLRRGLSVRRCSMARSSCLASFLCGVLWWLRFASAADSSTNATSVRIRGTLSFGNRTSDQRLVGADLRSQQILQGVSIVVSLSNSHQVFVDQNGNPLHVTYEYADDGGDPEEAARIYADWFDSLENASDYDYELFLGPGHSNITTKVLEIVGLADPPSVLMVLDNPQSHTNYPYTMGTKAFGTDYTYRNTSTDVIYAFAQSSQGASSAVLVVGDTQEDRYLCLQAEEDLVSAGIEVKGSLAKVAFGAATVHETSLFNADLLIICADTMGAADVLTGLVGIGWYPKGVFLANMIDSPTPLVNITGAPFVNGLVGLLTTVPGQPHCNVMGPIPSTMDYELESSRRYDQSGNLMAYSGAVGVTVLLEALERSLSTSTSEDDVSPAGIAGVLASDTFCTFVGEIAYTNGWGFVRPRPFQMRPVHDENPRPQCGTETDDAAFMQPSNGARPFLLDENISAVAGTSSRTERVKNITCALRYPAAPWAMKGLMIYPCALGHAVPIEDMTKSICTPTGHCRIPDDRCFACPPGKFRSQGATQCTTCIPGQYNHIEAQALCLPCPDGMDCDASTYENIPLSGWYYGAGEYEPSDFIKCAVEALCIGNKTCAPGSTGFLCQECEPGFYQASVGAGQLWTCSECPATAVSRQIYVMSSVVLFFVHVAIIIWSSEASAKTLWMPHGVLVKLWSTHLQQVAIVLVAVESPTVLNLFPTRAFVGMTFSPITMWYTMECMDWWPRELQQVQYMHIVLGLCIIPMGTFASYVLCLVFGMLRASVTRLFCRHRRKQDVQAVLHMTRFRADGHDAMGGNFWETPDFLRLQKHGTWKLVDVHNDGWKVVWQIGWRRTRFIQVGIVVQYLLCPIAFWFLRFAAQCTLVPGSSEMRLLIKPTQDCMEGNVRTRIMLTYMVYAGLVFILCVFQWWLVFAGLYNVWNYNVKKVAATTVYKYWQLRRRLGFLFEGYRDGWRGHEAFVTFRKAALILVLSFTTQEMRLTWVVSVGMVSLVVHEFIRPYDTRHFNLFHHVDRAMHLGIIVPCLIHMGMQGVKVGKQFADACTITLIVVFALVVAGMVLCGIVRAEVLLAFQKRPELVHWAYRERGNKTEMTLYRLLAIKLTDMQTAGPPSMMARFMAHFTLMAPMQVKQIVSMVLGLVDSFFKLKNQNLVRYDAARQVLDVSQLNQEELLLLENIICDTLWCFFHVVFRSPVRGMHFSPSYMTTAFRAAFKLLTGDVRQFESDILFYYQQLAHVGKSRTPLCATVEELGMMMMVLSPHIMCGKEDVFFRSTEPPHADFGEEQHVVWNGAHSYHNFFRELRYRSKVNLLEAQLSALGHLDNSAKGQALLMDRIGLHSTASQAHGRSLRLAHRSLFDKVFRLSVEVENLRVHCGQELLELQEQLTNSSQTAAFVDPGMSLLSASAYQKKCFAHRDALEATRAQSTDMGGATDPAASQGEKATADRFSRTSNGQHRASAGTAVPLTEPGPGKKSRQRGEEAGGPAAVARNDAVCIPAWDPLAALANALPLSGAGGAATTDVEPPGHAIGSSDEATGNSAEGNIAESAHDGSDAAACASLLRQSIRHSRASSAGDDMPGKWRNANMKLDQALLPVRGKDLQLTFCFRKGMNKRSKISLFDIRDEICMRIAGVKHGQVFEDLEHGECIAVGASKDSSGKVSMWFHPTKTTGSIVLHDLYWKKSTKTKKLSPMDPGDMMDELAEGQCE